MRIKIFILLAALVGIANAKFYHWNSSLCPSGYTETTGPETAKGQCKKTVNYTYRNYTCNANDKNSQGFGWELKDTVKNDGVKIDPDITANNTSTLAATISSHTTQPKCIRKYQECKIECPSPLVLEASTGKCIVDYAKECELKGMTYNSTLKTCEKIDQCNNTDAYLDDSTSDLCVTVPNCTVGTNGNCISEAEYKCDEGFFYSFETKACVKQSECSDNQIPLPNGKCGSIPYCDEGSEETLVNCIKREHIKKDCGSDARDNNTCYRQDSTTENMNIDYKRALIRVDLSGGYKTEEYGDRKSTFCNDDDGRCTFRLIKIEAKNNGKSLCFLDNVGGQGCINIEGECSVSGKVEFNQGIRQLLIGSDNKTIHAYNKAIKEEPIGNITSTCSISGKVGAIDTENAKREIIAAKADGIDILFWDSYRRGYIGILTFLPTIPEKDAEEGFKYEDPDVMELYRKGYTGFYSIGDSTYATYNGLISREKCLADLNGTTFYIPQAENEAEIQILNMLNFKGINAYNFNDGDNINGSCVIKSVSATSFNSQYFSQKRVLISNANSKFVCSTLDCKDNSCQYNQCSYGYHGDVIDQKDFNDFIEKFHPGANKDSICLEENCDSNKPYYPYCGNARGCKNLSDIFQQEDGRCVQVSCAEDEAFDTNLNKCIKLDCKDSYKKDGKCYKKLSL